MITNMLLPVGSLSISLWELACMIPSESVVDRVGKKSINNYCIIILDRVAEGLILISIGMLVLVVTLVIDSTSPSAELVDYGADSLLIVFAIWSPFTGARVPIQPVNARPFIQSIITFLHKFTGIL